jgi:hypothetical protein
MQTQVLAQIEEFCTTLTEWTAARAELEASKERVPPDMHSSMNELFAKLDTTVSLVVKTADATIEEIRALPDDQSAFIKPAMAKFNAIVDEYSTARRLSTPPQTPEASAQI